MLQQHYWIYPAPIPPIGSTSRLNHSGESKGKRNPRLHGERGKNIDKHPRPPTIGQCSLCWFGFLRRKAVITGDLGFNSHSVPPRFRDRRPWPWRWQRANESNWERSSRALIRIFMGPRLVTVVLGEPFGTFRWVKLVLFQVHNKAVKASGWNEQKIQLNWIAIPGKQKHNVN